MPLPRVTQSFTDGALGLVAALAEYHVKIGPCTKGVPNEAIIFADPKKVVEELGAGPLVEASCHAIAMTNRPVIAIPVETTAGDLSAITQTGTGPKIADDGSAPNDAYRLRIRITRAGAIGASAFHYSLDGGISWSPEIATVASYEVPGTGIKLTLPVGPYVEGEVYSADASPPSYDLAQAMAAADAALALPEKFRLIHLVGQAVAGGTVDDPITAAEASAMIATALGLKLASAEAKARYVYGIVEAPDASDAALKAAFKNVESRRVGVVAGFAELASVITGRNDVRHAAWPFVARVMAMPIHRHPGRVRDGALPGVGKLRRDENTDPGLDEARFITLRSFNGRPGAYVTRGNLMAPPGSDYSNVMHRQVADATADVVYAGLEWYVNDEVRIHPKTGFIDERDAKDIEENILAAMRAAIVTPGHASDVEFQLSRTDNILSTGTVHYKWRVLPLGYLEFIEGEGGFTNPALVQEAA